MARSRRKTPVFGHADTPSEKADKQRANRALRRRLHATLDVIKEPEILPELREVSNARTMGKDGRKYRGDATPAQMRK